MHFIENVYLQRVQNCLFLALNMEICDDVGALGVMFITVAHKGHAAN